MNYNYWSHIPFMDLSAFATSSTMASSPASTPSVFALESALASAHSLKVAAQKRARAAASARTLAAASEQTPKLASFLAASSTTKSKKPAPFCHCFSQKKSFSQKRSIVKSAKNGRKYFACSNSDGMKCGFLRWQDESCACPNPKRCVVKMANNGSFYHLCANDDGMKCGFEWCDRTDCAERSERSSGSECSDLIAPESPLSTSRTL